MCIRDRSTTLTSVNMVLSPFWPAVSTLVCPLANVGSAWLTVSNGTGSVAVSYTHLADFNKLLIIKPSASDTPKQAKQRPKNVKFMMNSPFINFTSRCV